MKPHDIATLGLSLALITAGCAAKSAQKAAPIRTTPAPGRAIVRTVSTEDNFVIVDFTARVMPAIGTQLDVYRQGKRVGAVRTTEPARSGFCAADVVEGDVHAGDDVR